MGTNFGHQASIGPYVVDFLCVERRLIVEVDGGQHDLEKEADLRRTADLEARGFRVIRVWNSEALQNTDGVVEYILQILSAGHPYPNPPPQGGRGFQRERGGVGA